MQNIKRNDPCLCGSGKKYKKCCGAKGDTDSMQAILEREIVDVQSEMLREAFSHNEFSHAVQNSISKYSPPEKMQESFYFFVGVWALFTSKVLAGKTALEQFCATRLMNLRSSVQGIVRTWIGKAPSVVRVEAVNGRSLTVRDVFSKEMINVKIIDKLTEIPNQGALLLGYIVPYANEVSIFFTSVLSFEDEVADKVEQFVCEKFAAYYGGADKDAGAAEASLFLQERFLELVDLFMSDRELDVVEVNAEFAASLETGDGADSELDIKNGRSAFTVVEKINEQVDQAAAVVNLLEEKVQSEDMPESVIEAGSTLWQKYYHKKQPTIKNEKVYAAALHYLLVDKVFPVYRRTQKATAELYNASIGSVSNRSREMACVLEEELKELCVK